MSVRRPLWLLFVPATASSQVRRVAFAAPFLMFGAAALAINGKQSYVRHSLADEKEGTSDRVERRGYVILPDGRAALVHPRVDTDFTLAGIWSSVKETFSLLP